MNERIFESFPELRTQRLFLRQITQEDDNNLFNVLSNEDTCAYLVHNAVHDIENIQRMITGIQGFLMRNKESDGELRKSRIILSSDIAAFLILTDLTVVQRSVTA